MSKVRCIRCQFSTRVHSVLISTSSIHLSSLQFKNLSKGISWFSVPSFNQLFRDYVTDLLRVSLKCVNWFWTWRCRLAEEDRRAWMTCWYINSNSQATTSNPGLPGTHWWSPHCSKVEKRGLCCLMHWRYELFKIIWFLLLNPFPWRPKPCTPVQTTFLTSCIFSSAKKPPMPLEYLNAAN